MLVRVTMMVTLDHVEGKKRSRVEVASDLGDQLAEHLDGAEVSIVAANGDGETSYVLTDVNVTEVK